MIVVLLSLFNHLYKPFHHSRVGVGEERALLFIEACHNFHIFGGKLKVEHVEILCHSFDMRRFGNDYDSPLQFPTQDYLRYRLSVFFTDLINDGIVEHIPPALAEGRPRLYLYAVLLHPFLRLNLLVKGVRFHLIDHRLYLCKGAEVNHSVGIEVGYADCTELSLFIQLFQRSPCAVIICKRLVKKH